MFGEFLPRTQRSCLSASRGCGGGGGGEGRGKCASVSRRGKGVFRLEDPDEISLFG